MQMNYIWGREHPIYLCKANGCHKDTLLAYSLKKQRCRQTAYKEKGVEMEMEFAVSYLELY